MEAEIRVRPVTFREAKDNLNRAYGHLDDLSDRHKREREAAVRRLDEARYLYMNTPKTCED